MTVIPSNLAHSSRGASNILDSNILSGCVQQGQYDPLVDYFPDKSAYHGDLFNITYFNNYKIVNVTSSKYKFSESYLLYQCGTPIPATYSLLKTFAVPVTTIGCDSSTDITFLELLGNRLAVKYLSGPSYFTSPCIQYLVANQSITAVSYNSTIAALQLNNTDVYFADAYNWASGKPLFPWVAADSEDDPSPLKRAEWIEFFGTFFNQEKAATMIYQNISARYMCHSNNAKIFPRKPVVAFAVIYGPPYTEYEISLSPYKLQLISDAGGVPLMPSGGSYYANGEAQQYTSVQDLLSALADVVRPFFLEC